MKSSNDSSDVWNMICVDLMMVQRSVGQCYSYSVDPQDHDAKSSPLVLFLKL